MTTIIAQSLTYKDLKHVEIDDRLTEAVREHTRVLMRLTPDSRQRVDAIAAYAWAAHIEFDTAAREVAELSVIAIGRIRHAQAGIREAARMVVAHRTLASLLAYASDMAAGGWCTICQAYYTGRRCTCGWTR